MFRNIGAVLIGLVGGAMVNMGLITLNMMVLFPTPPGMEPGDAVAMQAYIDQLPVTAFLVVILAHLGQAGVGGWIAARIAGTHPRRLAMTVAGLTLLGGLLNAQQIDAPAWTYIEMPLYLVVGWIAGTVEERRRATAG